MGRVQVATDPDLGRQLAVKRLLDDPGGQSVARFIREARVTGQLEHPNIVPVHELGRDVDGLPWLAMKRVQGESLHQRIDGWRKRKRLALTADRLAEVLDVFNRICDALAFAHSRQIIHRDLKPANVMLGEFGEVLVMDWGLARSIGPDSLIENPARAPLQLPSRSNTSTTLDTLDTGSPDPTAPLTVDGEVVGTPAFMPPEQAAGDIDKLDERSDIFALGGLLYAMLTLEPPYRADTVYQTLFQANTRALIAPRRRAPGAGIPRDLDAIVMKAMAAKQSDRYQTVADLQADLAAFRGHRAVSARRAPLWSKVVRWTRRHPASALAGAVAAVFAVVLLVVVGQLRLSQQQKETADQQRLAAEAEGREQDARRRAAEAEAREQQVKLLAEQERFDELREFVGVKAREDKEAARKALLQQWAQRPAGMDDGTFITTLDDNQILKFIRGFSGLLDASRATGETLHTASDLMFLGLLYGQGLRDREAGERYLNEALQLDPQNARAWANRGVLRSEMDRWTEALTDYNEALRLDPDNPDHLANRGAARAHMGDRHALDDFERALRQKPGNTNILQLRGMAKLMLGDPDGALTDLTAVVEQMPNNFSARFNRGAVLQSMRRFDEAIAIYEQLLADGMSTKELRTAYATTLHSSGRSTEAVPLLQKLTEEFPDYGKAFRELGTALAREHDYDAAMAAYDRALELEPGNGVTWFARGHCRLYHLSDRLPALADLEQAIKLGCNERRMYLDLGLALRLHRRYDDAVAAFRTAVERDPADSQAVGHLADLLATLGHAEHEWLPLLQQAWQLAAGDEGARNSIAKMFRRRGLDVPE